MVQGNLYGLINDWRHITLNPHSPVKSTHINRPKHPDWTCLFQE